MDIPTQAEIILRDAHYDTWSWSGPSSSPVTCFENAAVLGFVFVFPSVTELLATWRATQEATLRRHAASLRAGGAKAWNVYSVLLTPQAGDQQSRQIERLEEDFSHTRKIARAGIQTVDDLERALLPLVTIRSKPSIGAAKFEERLRSRLKDISADAVTAFLNETKSSEVARILGAGS